MPNNIDDRVVRMGLDNAEFERETKRTMTTLQRLKESLKFEGASSGFENITKSAKDVDVSNILAGVDALQQRFSTLGIVGMTIIQNLTNAITSKLSIAIGSVFNQIKTGGINRAMNIENAHFQLQGLISDEAEVQKIMAQALDSVDGTAYAYDEAAKAASMFAASGIAAGPQLYNALRGIAGVAATTNAQYQEISSIFTTVAGQGRVMSYQLNQLAFRGMNAAAALTNYFNGVSDGSVTASDNVKEIVNTLTKGKQITESELRELVGKGIISFELFSEAMSTTFGEHAKDANKTFTGAFANIKAALSRTGAMFVSPLIEQEGPFVGFFNAIRVKINEMNAALKPAAERVTTFVNSFITSFTKIVEKVDISKFTTSVITGIEGIITVFSRIKSSIGSVLKPIIDAFKSVFGIKSIFKEFKKPIGFVTFDTKSFKTISDKFPKLNATFEHFGKVLKEAPSLLASIVNKIKEFIESLVPSEKLISKISSVATNVFEAIKNGIGYIVTFVSSFISQIKESGSVLDNFKAFFTGVFDAAKAFGDILSRIVTSIFPDFGKTVETSGIFLGKMAIAISQILGFFGKLLTKFSEWIESSPVLMDIFDKIRDGFTRLKDAIGDFVRDHSFDASPLIGFFEKVLNAASKLKEVFHKVFTAIGNIVGGLIKTIGSFGGSLVEAFGKVDTFDALMGFINAFMSSGITYAIYKMAGAISELRKSGPGVFLSRIKSVLWEVTNTLKVMQASIAAGTIKDIAKAVLLLAVALILLSTVDPEAMFPALMGVGALLLMVTGMLKWLLDSFKPMALRSSFTEIFGGIVDSLKTFLSLKALGAVIKNIGIALLLLAVGVRILADLSWEQLGKGIVTMAMLALVLAEFAVLTKGAKTGAGLGLIALAVSMLILVSVVKKFGQMDIGALEQGGIALAGLMIALGLMLNLMPKGGKVLGIGIGLMFLATAMVILGAALKSLSKIPTDGLIMSIVSFITILGALAAAFAIMPNGLSMIGIGIGMVFVATAIGIITLALKALSKIPVESLIVSIGALIAVLAVLAITMNIMNGSLLGAVSLLVAAAAIGVLTAALIALSLVNTERIVTGLFSVIVVLFTLGTAAMILSALWGPMLIGAGVMLALAAAGLVLGAACIVLGTGMTALGVGIKALIGGILDILMQVVELGKALIYGLGEGIVSAVGWIISIIEQVGGLVIKVFKAIFGINSPSRVFGEIGVFNMLGLGNGMAAGSSYVTDISGAIGENVLGEFSGMSGEFFNIGEGSGQEYLSGITSGVSGSGGILSSLFGNGQQNFDNPGTDVGYGDMVNEKLVLKGVRDEADMTTAALGGTTDAYQTFLSGLNTGEGDVDMSSFLDGFNSGELDMSGYSVDMSSALASISDSGEDFKAAGSNLADQVILGLQETLSSIDSVTSGANEFISAVTSFIDTEISAKTADLQASGKSMGDNVSNGYGSTIPAFVSAASDTVQGVLNGLLSSSSLARLYRAGATMAERVNKGYRDNLRVQSPSRVFYENGQYTVQGLMNGITSMMDQVYKTGEDLGNAAIFGSQTALSIIGEMAGSDVVFSPVVRPVLDLTNVQNGSRQISAIFSRKQALAAGSAFHTDLGGSTGTKTAKGTTYTFTQNNYSPKALSRQEIYRQTKNQFNSFERQMKYK